MGTAIVPARDMRAMRSEHGSVLAHIVADVGPRHALLIDPAKQAPDVAARRALAAVERGSRLILVGGSTDTPDDVVHSTCQEVQEALELAATAASQDPMGDEARWQVPVVLFPGGAHALSPAADGILFMMLMNSTDRRFLVEEQARGAPFVHRFGLDAVPTGYVVIEPGGEVGRVGRADLVAPDDAGRVEGYAHAGAMYGFRLLYLEAGSGASEPVRPEMIRTAAAVPGLVVMVGGGLRTGHAVRAAVEAGADWVVTGTLIEDADAGSALHDALDDILSGLA
jgi:phosphoglycerol geranylgeranyltransferase